LLYAARGIGLRPRHNGQRRTIGRRCAPNHACALERTRTHTRTRVISRFNRSLALCALVAFSFFLSSLPSFLSLSLSLSLFLQARRRIVFETAALHLRAALALVSIERRLKRPKLRLTGTMSGFGSAFKQVARETEFNRVEQRPLRNRGSISSGVVPVSHLRYAFLHNLCARSRRLFSRGNPSFSDCPRT